MTASDITDELAGEGITVDRRRLLLDEPIKELGVYNVKVDLHEDVRPELKIWVVAEE
ncbi:MAG: 50S ribosomal L9 C-terminal domain-containing protein [Gemmatimonadota bacterium]